MGEGKPCCIKVRYGGSLRRVVLPDFSISKLRANVEDVFSGLPKHYVFKQKDCDGDHITISTDEDLKLAVTECKKYLKLEIRPSSGTCPKGSRTTSVSPAPNNTPRRSEDKKRKRAASVATFDPVASTSSSKSLPSTPHGSVRRPLGIIHDFTDKEGDVDKARIKTRIHRQTSHMQTNRPPVYTQQPMDTDLAVSTANTGVHGRPLAGAGRSLSTTQLGSAHHQSNIGQKLRNFSSIPTTGLPYQHGVNVGVPVAHLLSFPASHPHLLVRDPSSDAQPAILINEPDPGVPMANVIPFSLAQTAPPTTPAPGFSGSAAKSRRSNSIRTTSAPQPARVGRRRDVERKETVASESSNSGGASQCRLSKCPIARSINAGVRNVMNKGRDLFTAWVGGVCEKMEGLHLKRLFQEKFPSVVSARVIKCKETGKSRFGFVEFESKEERDRAVTEMNGEVFIKGPLSVAPARTSCSPAGRGGLRSSPARSRHVRSRSGEGLKGNEAKQKSLRLRVGKLPLEVSEIRKDDRAVVGEPGDVVKKTFVLQNSGDAPWPPMTHVAYDDKKREGALPSLTPLKTEIFLPPLPPGKVAFATAHFRLPKEKGEYEAIFRVNCPLKQRFGQRCVARIKVVDDAYMECEDPDMQPGYYTKEIEKLVSLGFNDEELIEHLFKETRGDVHNVAMWLEANIGRGPNPGERDVSAPVPFYWEF
eukprot:CAMPEP_0184483970 /NCGR_PEP_ID=MMETSP0113_2-20130426/5657_1 /TAXON_ID=91329 /ORGANISM="Norrisiella sphaerica, Strain BC52" /LENGTH=701 /DNA_ID=CAMNT_0026864683 /DNA_START=292 /DNA_END=2397 /DNA_ORIENTATION=+